jgi:hypothetical protein
VYWYVRVHTGTYQYILVRTILPDPVQVYRIPDDVITSITCRYSDISLHAHYRDIQDVMDVIT